MSQLFYQQILGGGIVLMNVLLAFHVARNTVLKDKSMKWTIKDVKKKKKKETTYLRAYMDRNILTKLSETKFFMKAKQRLARVGDSRDSTVIGYMIMLYALPGLLLVKGVFARDGTVLMGILLHAGFQLWISATINSQELQFKKEAYRMYKFLNNQLYSGVRQIDALKSLYITVDDPVLKVRLQNMADMLIATNNIDHALKPISKYYVSAEARSLVSAIRLGLQTGDNKKTIKKKEENMFKAYLHYIKAETDKVKMKCFFIACIYGLVMVVLLTLPIMAELTGLRSEMFRY